MPGRYHGDAGRPGNAERSVLGRDRGLAAGDAGEAQEGLEAPGQEGLVHGQAVAEDQLK